MTSVPAGEPKTAPIVKPVGVTSTRGVVALSLVVVGLVLWIASRFVTGGDEHSYSPDATPPSQVTLTAGHTYAIALPGGVKRDDLPATLTCSATSDAGDRTTLRLTSEADDTRALTRLARFVAPDSGPATVTCADLPPVFVDDADDAGYDYSGLCVVLACLTLAIGLPLLLSVLRRPRPEPL